MLYTIPDYYFEFDCIADSCPETCCAGWQIVIDEKTLERYKHIKGDIRPRMLRSVNWRQGVFRQKKGKRCTFLNDRNLCDLYLSEGEAGFCKTCRNYPRHIEEFEGVREISLSVSCPEVARILMERMSPVNFISRENEGEEEYEDFDPFLFSVLEDARASMLTILQNRDISLRERAVLVLAMAHDLQIRISRGNLFASYDVIKKYEGQAAGKFIRDYLQKDDCRVREIAYGAPMFRKLYELELLQESWEDVLKETEEVLYGKGENNYGRIKDAFSDWKKQNPEMDIHLEQLLVYFLFTYLPGAVYDGLLFAKVQMAVYCVWMIEEIWMARWKLNGEELFREEMIRLLYRFSREVEHSDENLKLVEHMMEPNWMLK